MFIRGLFGVIAAILFLATSATAQTILIGLSSPITGPAATAAMWERWGVDLAVDEVNGAGGLLGRKIEILQLDNHCNPSEAVNVANKLIEAKVVAIVGAHCSSATLATMPLIKDAKIPMVGGVASAPNISDQSGVGGNPWIFRINPTDKDMMNALGLYLGKSTGFKKVAVVAEDSDFGRGGVDAFKPVAQANGIAILSTDIHPQSMPDFTSILTRIQQERPDAIALFQLGGDQLNLLRSAMQLGLHIPYTGRAELGGANVQIIEAGGMEGSVSVWGYSQSVDTPANIAFVKAIQQRDKSIPYLQTWAGYDSLKIIAQAIQAAGTVDPVKIRDAIQHIDFHDMLGKDIRFDDHNQGARVAVVNEVKDRKIIVAGLVDIK
jgi:branched-chain amino acid transport system substrate-binding protein